MTLRENGGNLICIYITLKHYFVPARRNSVYVEVNSRFLVIYHCGILEKQYFNATYENRLALNIYKILDRSVGAYFTGQHIYINLQFTFSERLPRIYKTRANKLLPFSSSHLTQSTLLSGGKYICMQKVELYLEFHCLSQIMIFFHLSFTK